MNDQDRQAIEPFGRLGEVERQAPPRDAESDGFIAEQIRRQPGAPYYMAQTIVVQEAALLQAQERIAALEAEAARAPAGGGFLSRLLGGAPAPAPRPRPAPAAAAGQPFSQQGGQQGGRGGPAAAPGAWGARPGGGFLAGAAQTAVGVAGGMILADMLTDAFSGAEDDLAQLAEAPEDALQAASFEDAGDFGDDFEI